MNNLFEPIAPKAIEKNIFELIGADWMLICSGNPGNYNMMTASWGTAGYLWNKPVAFIFVRPQRYTFSFLETNPYFTLNFFDKTMREVLNLCGTKSGRHINKMQVDGLTSVETEKGNVFFEQAQLVLECRKIYFDDIKPDFFQSFDIEKVYPSKDYHRFYVGEIMNSWKRKTVQGL